MTKRTAIRIFNEAHYGTKHSKAQWQRACRKLANVVHRQCMADYNKRHSGERSTHGS